MYIDQVLIPAQFCGMISADAFMPVRCNTVVKSTGSHIEHPIMFGGIAENSFIGRCFCKKLSYVGFMSKMTVVQIAFIYRPQIDKAKSKDACCRCLSFQFMIYHGVE